MQLTLSDREAAAVHHALFLYERWLRGLVWIGHGVTDDAVARDRSARSVLLRIEDQRPEFKKEREKTK